MSRIGSHYLHPGTDGGRELALHTTGATIIKSVNDVSILSDAKERNPQIITIARKWLSTDGASDWDPMGHAHESPQAIAEMAWDWVSDYALHPFVDYCEIENEPFLNRSEIELNWYAAYLKHLMSLFNRNGVKACIINASTGTPEPYVWPLLADAIKMAVRDRHILGLHEYAHPRISGSFTSDWLWYRHKAALNHLAAAGVDAQRLRIAITEFGVDGTIQEHPQFTIDQAQKRGSYRDGVLSDAEYIQRLKKFDQNAAPQVIGACVYTVGSNGSPRWDAFNIAGTSLAARFVDLANSASQSQVRTPSKNDVTTERRLLTEAAADEIDRLLVENEQLAARKRELEKQHSAMLNRALRAEARVRELEGSL